MCASDFRMLKTRVRCVPSPARGRESRSSRRLALILLVALPAFAFADGAHAQFYKGKTLTMIINYPAGGPSDIEGRIVAQHLPAPPLQKEVADEHD